MGIMKEGEEIIVPANIYIASILAISDNKLTQVLVEPSIDTSNLDISKTEQHISSQTKAILVVHLYGRICWSFELEEIVYRNNLRTEENNAQAAGVMIIAQGAGHRAWGKNELKL